VSQAASLTDRRRALLAVGTALALLAALLLPAAPGAASERWPVWIAPAESALPAAAKILQALLSSGSVLLSTPFAPAAPAPADMPLQWKQLDLGGEKTDTARGAVFLDSGVAAIGAHEVWGTTQGEGAVVALIDTGVAPIAALNPDGPDSAVAGEIDFSGSGSGDGYGHGTFLASLIAGRGETAPGVAPGSLVLSLKVADDSGATDLSKVLGALQWLYGPGQASGIRIAVLALGVDADTKAGELLDRATAALAQQGVLVVTAAGNDGAGKLTSPATSPATFSVGALGDLDQDIQDYDEVADFSGTGADRRGVAQPDLVAPGVRVAGSLSADSEIAKNNADSQIPGTEGFDDVFLHGSGTSMATALTAGVAALASSARPDLTGHELATALRTGDGRLDASAAVNAAQDAEPVRGHPGKGSAPQPAAKAAGKGNGNGPNDAADPQGIRWVDRDPWDGAAWGAEHWDGIRWVGIRWVGIRWVGIRWVDDSWGDESWAEDLWGGIRWVGIRWVGIRWVGIRWVDDTWNAETHTGIRWVGVRWA
jgi:serine protease AprX